MRNAGKKGAKEVNLKNRRCAWIEHKNGQPKNQPARQKN
jgi:hypothetical protein